MGSAYGISNCLGWYLAGVGVFSDLGQTPAQDGEPIAQWNDQSGAGNPLTQTTAANRPVLNRYLTRGGGSIAPFGTAMTEYGIDSPAGICFNDATQTGLELPASLTVASGSLSAIFCTRGSGSALLGLSTIGYGAIGAAGAIGLLGSDGTLRTSGAYPSLLQPTVHGFVAGSQGCTVLRGVQQNPALAGITVASNNGGVLGRLPGSTDPGFTGEVLEFALFDRAIEPAEAQAIVAAMQASNGLAPDAGANLLLLVGDEQIAGDPAAAMCEAFPYWLARSYGGSFHPLQSAAAGQTCVSQQTTLQSLSASLDVGAFAGRVAVVCCGVNDVLLDGCSAAELIARFTSLVQTVQTFPSMRVIAAVPLLQAGATGVTTGQQAAIDVFRAWLTSGAGGVVDGVIDWTADARLVDGSSAFRAGPMLTTELGSRVKAVLMKPAVDAQLATVIVSPGALSYGLFYDASRSFTGVFGNFVRA